MELRLASAMELGDGGGGGDGGGTATASGVNPLPFQVMPRPVKGGILQVLQAGVDVRLRTD